jgi:14-3-3 protein epsilon
MTGFMFQVLSLMLCLHTIVLIKVEVDGDKEAYIYRAELAQRGKRYDDMMSFMKKIAEMNIELLHKERVLLTSGYTNAIDNRRLFWTSLRNVEENEIGKRLQIAMNYRTEIGKEVFDICISFLTILDNRKLYPPANDTESKIEFLTMKGNQYRFINEISLGNETAAEIATEIYKEGCNLLNENISPLNPARLRFIGSYVSFLLDTENNYTKAIALTQKEYDLINSLNPDL